MRKSLSPQYLSVFQVPNKEVNYFNANHLILINMNNSDMKMPGQFLWIAKFVMILLKFTN